MELRSTTASSPRADGSDASLFSPRELRNRVGAMAALDPDRRRSLQQELQTLPASGAVDSAEQAAILRSTHDTAWRLLHLSNPVTALLKPLALRQVPEALFHQVDQEV